METYQSIEKMVHSTTSLKKLIDNLPQELKWIIMSYSMEHPCKKEIEVESEERGRIWWSGRFLERGDAELLSYYQYYQDRLWFTKRGHDLVYSRMENKLIHQEFNRIRKGLYTQKELKKIMKDNNVKGRSKINYKNPYDVLRVLIKL